MKKSFILSCLLVSIGINAQTKIALTKTAQRTISFDGNWLFIKDSSIDAARENYDDKSWRRLDLPHDWAIEDLPGQIADSIVGPFSKAAISGRDGGFLVGGTAWYRKHFVVDKASANKKIFVQFDGVYMNADVWLNGHHLGNHPYGYTSFYYELTPYLNPVGQSNVIAVQVKNTGRNSRWYSGSGIYRHVWLTTVNALHIDTWGTFITTPSVSKNAATVSVISGIKNNYASFTIITKIYTPAGQLAGTDQQLIASPAENVVQKISLPDPQLWSVEKPVLYTAKISLLKDGKVVDEITNRFGIRSIHFDAQTGFTLNGNSIKLHGGCIHHDNGPLGAAAIDRAEERKIELLKRQGYNAIRLSHNPPSPQLLDACDRIGMLVIDEAFDIWEQAKTPQDYHLYFNEWSMKDIQSMILRDRNHPCIIMWSIGNEIPEVLDSSGYAIGKRLSAAIRDLDTTRAVTMAVPIFAPLGKKNKTWDDAAPSFANLEVAGYNYAHLKYESDHVKFPNRVMYASEYFPPKGIDNWLKVENLPYVIGVFSWTAMDYLGEAGLGAPRLIPSDTKGYPGSNLFLDPAWPIFNAYTGELDLIGNKKVNAYYLDVVWKRSAVEVLVHKPIPDTYKEANFYYNFPDQLKSWSFPGQEGKKMQVYVYSRAQKVTLELNGKIVGEQKMTANNITAQFDLAFEPGTLIAKSYVDEKQTGADTLVTVGKPFAIRLKADRNIIKANRNELSYINVDVVDVKGNVVPYIDDLLIKYDIQGNGEIAGVANGNPADVSSFQQPEKKVFHGMGLVIIRPKGNAGKIRMKAEATGLAEDSIVIITK